jgi:hypothetical protein
VNSSTSISEPFPAGDRVKAIVFLAILAVSLGAVMAFNWVIDPYNRFHTRSDGAHAADGQTNLVLEAMVEVAKIPASAKQKAEVVIMGDSRARNLTDSRITTDNNRSILNLGIGGSSFEETISFLNDQAPSLQGVRLLILGVPLERLAAAPRADRCLEVKPIVGSPLRYLANAEMLKNSWGLWRRPVASPGKTSREERTPEERQQDDKTVRSTWRRMYGDYEKDRVNARVAALRDAVKPFTSRGATVVFWSPPIREEIRFLMDKLDLQDERARLSEKIAAFGTVMDMTEWTTIAGQSLTFKDAVHANEAALILKELQAVFPR